MMSQLIHWVRVDSSGLGRPQLPGDTPVNIMAVPMMLLCLVQQLTEERGQEVAEKYREVGDWCVKQILQHVQVLELICQHSYWCLLVRMRKKKIVHNFHNVCTERWHSHFGKRHHGRKRTSRLPGPTAEPRLIKQFLHLFGVIYPQQAFSNILEVSSILISYHFLAKAMPWKQAGSCFNMEGCMVTRPYNRQLWTSSWRCLFWLAGIRSMGGFCTSWMWMVIVPHRYTDSRFRKKTVNFQGIADTNVRPKSTP